MKPLEELLEIAKSAKERADNAHEHICKLAKDGAKSWRLSIPVQDDDSDVLLQAPLDLVPQLSDAVIDLITQLKDAQVEIKSLNTFNTQFTRADKISWGGLYIQVEQLEQRLAECETALKKALEFGEYADWAIDADKNLQQLDIDSRAYLTKWGVK